MKENALKSESNDFMLKENTYSMTDSKPLFSLTDKPRLSQ